MTAQSPGWLSHADRHADWSSLRVAVVGIGASGFAAADSLLQVGASVIVVAESDDEISRDKGTLLEILGAEVRIGPGVTATPPEDVGLVVTSPGVTPRSSILTGAEASGVPVWGEVELAWRLREPETSAPWLCVTGTNGKTTTVGMLDAMLRAAGLRSIAAGNVGTPVVQAVMDPEAFDVIAVELSSAQLHWTYSMSAEAAVVLNVAPDHLDWHDSEAAYASAKGRIYQRGRIACVYNVEDPRTEQLVRDADVEEGCRAIGFTLGTPGVGMLGVVDGALADRAFVQERQTSAAEIGGVSDVQPQAPHNVANALAAAALARAHGVAPTAVRDGLRAFQVADHRIETVAAVGGVTYVDDSKATNPHAAQASLAAFNPVVWIAGGQAKGARFDDLVLAMRSRLRAVVLLGTDSNVIGEALSRHAPDVRVIEVPGTDTLVMDRVVAEASRAAEAGDTVLLAPGCASKDMFTDYGARGDAFTAAVHRLGEL
jgi:UDP-N-acetylmuramoylalanine--D-glutamate ligase